MERDGGAVRYWSRAKIKDEFTDLNVSRQRKGQLRNKRDGKCVKCGNPNLVTKEYCEKHRKMRLKARI